tara:strand:+ start:487 stop:966 length:480 start_codon:yes stop_codon:yes gene_type:complete
MKITKQRLKEIIREELNDERWATVPQVQRYAADAGVKLSYGDAKTLAAQTPAERSALMRLQGALKDGSWKGMREELETTSVGADIEDYPQPENFEDPTSRLPALLGTREEQLLSRILSRAVVDRYESLQDLADDLGLEMTPDMVRFLGSLKANPMYGST